MLSPKPRGQLRGDSLAAAMDEVKREENERLNVNVPQSVYRRFKSRAAMAGLSVTDIINGWINEYLSSSDGSK